MASGHQPTSIVPIRDSAAAPTPQDLTTSILDSLTTIPFACGGTIPLLNKTDTVQLRYGPQDAGKHLTLPTSSAPSQPTDSTALQDLLAACAPATFGLGGQDVLDETYRKAIKLPPTEFLTDFCPYKAGIVDVIAQLLVPEITGEAGGRGGKGRARGVEAELYMLNIYSGPGGFFRPHVDTPRRGEQFGSLVVCLPVRFQGR